MCFELLRPNKLSRPQFYAWLYHNWGDHEFLMIRSTSILGLNNLIRFLI